MHPSDTVRDAIEIMTKYDVSQMPVLTAEPPVVMGEVIGAITERDLMEHVFSNGAKMTDAVRDFVGPPLALDRGARDAVLRPRRRSATATPSWSPTTGSPRPCSRGTTCSAFLSE